MATVLIVDDERDVRDLLRLALHFDHHSVAEAKGAHEARDLALLLNPDVIVTDHRMGRDGTGIDLVRDLRDRGITCPIIFWTGSNGVRDLALAAGADHYFVKSRDSLALLRAAVDEASRPHILRVVSGA